MATFKYPLPPFLPRGGVIQYDKWADHGEWKDEQILFPGTVVTPSSTTITTQTGGYIITQDGQEIIIQ